MGNVHYPDQVGGSEPHRAQSLIEGWSNVLIHIIPLSGARNSMIEVLSVSTVHVRRIA